MAMSGYLRAPQRSDEGHHRTAQFPLVSRLSADQVESVLGSTLLAPSTYSTQP